MIPPKPTTAYNCEDGTRRHFASIKELSRKLDMAESYVTRKMNTCNPVKGWLVYDDDHADSPEAKEALSRLVNGYDKKNQRKQAKKKGFVSVRIDKKTVILVPASKWTEDYAERYREKMANGKGRDRSYDPTDFIHQNNHLMDNKKRGGRR